MPQSLAKIYTHLVFSTKGRTDTIPKQHLEEVHAYVAGILNDNKCPAVKVGGTANHIHILFVLNRTMALSDVVRIVKSNSSKWINERNGIFNPFSWQDGYGAFSISNGHVDAVVNYIANQEVHHRGMSFEDEYRHLCEIYDAGLDERYAWD